LEALTATKATVLAELAKRHEKGEILGALLISTCNRFEILIDQHPEKPVDPRQFMSAGRTTMLQLQGRAAVEHLLRVTVGLESIVAGEDQIQGQVRRAFKEAEDLNLLSRNLHMLRNRTLAAAKDVRRSVGLSAKKISLPALGADLLLENANSLAIVGAGETARIAIDVLRRKFSGELWIINRSLDRAEKLAAHFDARAMSLEEFLQQPPEVDGILFAVYSDRLLLKAGQIPSLEVVVDLCMPSVLEPSLQQEPGLKIWDLNTIRERAARESRSRDSALTACASLIEAQCSALWHDLTSDESRFNRVIDMHLESAVAEYEHAARGRLRHLSARDQDIIKRLIIKSAKRNAHYHLKDLRNLAVS
jgi:glutamyl-tRNA reductase